MQHMHQYEQFRKEVGPAIASKQAEFKMLGYEDVTQKELWEFLINKKWKRPKEDVCLYEIVADILAIQPGEYMNFMTVEAFKHGQSVLEDKGELSELLK
jgi:hypothetical protein